MGQQKKGRDRSRPFNSLYPTCFRHWDTQICKFSEAYLLISKQLTFCSQKSDENRTLELPVFKKFCLFREFCYLCKVTETNP